MEKRYDEKLNVFLQKLITPKQKLITPKQTLENIDAAYHLIKTGADPNLRSEDGTITILFPVIMQHNLDLLKKFIEAGCDYDTVFFNKEKPIDMALSFLIPEMVEYLLSLSKGDYFRDLVYHFGRVSKRIHLLAATRYPEDEGKQERLMKTLKIMLDYGSDLLERDLDGKRPLDKAIELNYYCYKSPFVKLLQEETEKCLKLREDESGLWHRKRESIFEEMKALKETNRRLSLENFDLKEQKNIYRRTANELFDAISKTDISA